MTDYTSKEFWEDAPEQADYCHIDQYGCPRFLHEAYGKWYVKTSDPILIWQKVELSILEEMRLIPRPNFGHPHADLMAQYAEDAKETDKPWERWERKIGPTGEWTSLGGNHPLWNADYQYRRKPKTRTAEEILEDILDGHKQLCDGIMVGNFISGPLDKVIAEARALLNKEKP